MSEYQVGIIGCGNISGSHFRGFAETKRAKVSYAWDIDQSAAQQAAQEWDAQVAASAEVLIKASDIVTIATPGFAHRTYIEMAAAAGKHVLCEKPLALNMEDALAIKETVEEAGITFMVALNQRYTPTFVQLKQVQDSGRIGGTVSAWARWHAPASSVRWRQIQESGHWRSSVELSGGRITEFCSHAINWLLWVLGEPKTIYGRALHVTEGFELDDADYALLTCEHGVGLLEVNRHAGVAREENYGILGHGGSVVVRDEGIFLTPMDEETVEVPIDPDVPTKHTCFLDYIETGAKPRTGIDDAIDTLRVCLAFNRSAHSDQVEPVKAE